MHFLNSWIVLATLWPACPMPIQNEHRSFPSLSIFLQHYYLLWCVWQRNTVFFHPPPFRQTKQDCLRYVLQRNTVPLDPSSKNYWLQYVWQKNTVSLHPALPPYHQKAIGSGTCDRETPFLFTPPFHHTIKKLYTPHQQQQYRYYLTREKFKS